MGSEGIEAKAEGNIAHLSLLLPLGGNVLAPGWRSPIS